MVVGSEAKELARASIELREVCLHESSFWAAEQLKGLPLHEEEVNMAKTEGIKQALQASDLSPEFHLARQFFEEKARTFVSWKTESNGLLAVMPENLLQNPGFKAFWSLLLKN